MTPTPTHSGCLRVLWDKISQVRQVDLRRGQGLCCVRAAGKLLALGGRILCGVSQSSCSVGSIINVVKDATAALQNFCKVFGAMATGEGYLSRGLRFVDGDCCDGLEAWLELFRWAST